MKSVFVFTNTQKVLDYLANHPGEQLLANEIQGKLKISRGGVNQSLRELAEEGLICREKKGNIFLYSLNHSSPVVKQYKILKNTEMVYPLANKLKEASEKIILFGSSARGEDVSESDVDIFILTREPDAAAKIIQQYKIKRKIQMIIRTPAAYTDMESKEPVFFEEINRGITVMENKG